jgi:hypothetical protein
MRRAGPAARHAAPRRLGESARIPRAGPSTHPCGTRGPRPRFYSGGHSRILRIPETPTRTSTRGPPPHPCRPADPRENILRRPGPDFPHALRNPRTATRISTRTPPRIFGIARNAPRSLRRTQILPLRARETTGCRLWRPRIMPCGHAKTPPHPPGSVRSCPCAPRETPGRSLWRTRIMPCGPPESVDSILPGVATAVPLRASRKHRLHSARQRPIMPLRTSRTPGCRLWRTRIMPCGRRETPPHPPGSVRSCPCGPRESIDFFCPAGQDHALAGVAKRSTLLAGGPGSCPCGARMAGVEGLEPTALGFGDRCSTS